VETHSAHWIAERSFRAAVADYLERERRVIRQEIAGLAEFSPFRKSDC